MPAQSKLPPLAPATSAKVAKKNSFNSNDEAWKANIRNDESYEGIRPAWWWTGRSPHSDCPGMQADGTITSLPLPNLATVTRQQALDYFDNTWTITEVLFSALQGEEAFYRPPYHNLRHPFIFYYVHPAALYVNKLRVAGILDQPVNPYFERIFETGVDEMSWDDLSKNDMEWPSLKEATAYRKTVYELVRNVINTHPDFDNLPITWDSPCWALFMGFEHERIHVETSSVLMRELPLHLLRRPPQWPHHHPHVPHVTSRVHDTSNHTSDTSVDSTPIPVDPTPIPVDPTHTPDNPLVQVPAGAVVVGKAHDWPSFGWDNEYGCRKFEVGEFSASKCLISNGEYLQFVKAGGYRQEGWWSTEGWHWRTFRNAKWPTFWVLDGPAGLHQYKLRMLFEEVPLPHALPVVVNHHEAKAYCAWKSTQLGLTGAAALRLLTEPEHHRLRETKQVDAEGRAAHDPIMHHTGVAMRAITNTNMAYGGECPVDALPPTHAGFYDVHGNVWQWCEDYFAALPHSKGVHPLYDDFSTPCYDGEHNIIMGASFTSTGDEASVFSRFHFRPHFFQHAGFRVVSSTAPLQTSCMDSPGPHVGSWDPSVTTAATNKATQRADALQQRLLLHYGQQHVLPLGLGEHVSDAWSDMPGTIVDMLLTTARQLGVNIETALDIGCDVGGVALRLAQHLHSVLAVDGSADAIAVANGVKEEGSMDVTIKREGHITTKVSLQSGVAPEHRARVTFKQMDACCLAPDLPCFDLITMVNLLDHTVSPKAPLGRLAGQRALLRQGGLLVVSCAYQWSDRVADPQLWLGGTAAEQSAAQGLARALGPSFRLVREQEVPMVMRVNDRRCEVHMAHTSIWQRVE